MSTDFGTAPSQFQLTKEGKEIAQELKQAGWFSTENAVAKFALAVALREDPDLDPALPFERGGAGQEGSSLGMNTLDPQFEMEALMRSLFPEARQMAAKDLYNVMQRLCLDGLRKMRIALSEGRELSYLVE